MQTKEELLIEAAKHGNVESMVALIQDGANMNVRNKSGWDALGAAIDGGHIDAFRTLLNAGANVNGAPLAGPSRSGNHTSLMTAAASGNIQFINILLDSGADLYARNYMGRTALSIAVGQHQLETIKVLLTKGAIRNNDELQHIIKVAEQFMRTTPHGATIYVNSGGARVYPDQTLIAKDEQVSLLLRNFGTFSYRLNESEFDETRLRAEDKEVYTRLCCPISHEIMNDPITVTTANQTYDREWLKAYFKANGNPETLLCPLTRLPIQRSELTKITNSDVKNDIDMFVSQQETEFQHRQQMNTSTHAALASDVGLFATTSRDATTSSTSAASTPSSASSRSGPDSNI